MSFFVLLIESVWLVANLLRTGALINWGSWWSILVWKEMASRVCVRCCDGQDCCDIPCQMHANLIVIHDYPSPRLSSAQDRLVIHPPMPWPATIRPQHGRTPTSSGGISP